MEHIYYSCEYNMDDLDKLLDKIGHYPKSIKEIEKFAQPLHFAVENEDRKLLELAFEAGADVNMKASPMKPGMAPIKGEQPPFQAPIHVAAQQGNIEMIEKLVEAGANIKILNGQKLTPLLLFCNRKDVSESDLQKLVEMGANLDDRDPHSGDSVAHLLASRDKWNELLYLLNNTKNVNVMNHNGDEILHCLLISDSIPLLLLSSELKILIDAFKNSGGELSLTNKNSETFVQLLTKRLKNDFKGEVEKEAYMMIYHMGDKGKYLLDICEGKESLEKKASSESEILSDDESSKLEKLNEIIHNINGREQKVLHDERAIMAQIICEEQAKQAKMADSGIKFDFESRKLEEYASRRLKEINQIISNFNKTTKMVDFRWAQALLQKKADSITETLSDDKRDRLNELNKKSSKRKKRN